MYIDVECFLPGDKVPLLHSSSNQTTVEGLMITFQCTYKGNYSPDDYTVFWMVAFQNGSHILVQDDSNFSDYHIRTQQNCPDSNYSCCRFITELSIHTSIPLNNAKITCSAILNSNVSTSNGSYLSELCVCII